MEFLIAILLGVIASLIAQLIWNVYAYRIPILRKPPKFSLSGIYATRISSRMVDGEFAEIVKIRQKGNKLNFYMENYNSNRISVWMYGGNGYCRASQIALSYSPVDKSKPNIGVFSIKSIIVKLVLGLLPWLFRAG